MTTRPSTAPRKLALPVLGSLPNRALAPPRASRQAARNNRFTPNSLLWVLSGAPWIWGLIRDDGSPARFIHRTIQQHARRQHGSAERFLRGALFVAGIPAVLSMIAICTAKLGPRVRQQAGKPLLRQGWEQLAVWLTRGVPPLSYYALDLYEHDARAAALDYLYRCEIKGEGGVYDLLRSRFSSTETTEALRNKALFASACRERGVPAVPVLFAVEDGKLTRLDADEPGLPRCDLFLKPLSGSGGRGAAAWAHVGHASYRNDSAGCLSESELVEHLVKLSRREAQVGRQYVSNHPELADLSSGALCSVRVVTCLDENGRPQVTNAALRMARTPGIVVDNFHAGGIASAVDLASGVIGSATDLGLNRRTRWWDAHPTTGARIAGRQVPMWHRVLDLARAAHEVFADQIVVGWDVAVLEGGPQLIEGNKSPDLDIVQRTTRRPIGNSRLGALLAYHLERAVKEPASLAVRARRPSRAPISLAAATARAGTQHAEGRGTMNLDPEQTESTRWMLTLDEDVDLSSPAVQKLALQELESGGIVFLPASGFALTDEECALICDAKRLLVKEPEIRNGRPTIVYEPSSGRIRRHYALVNGRPVRTPVKPAALPRIEAMLSRFGRWADVLTARLFPSYVDGLTRDRITYRPNERAAAQPLHVDSSYGFPTDGRGMLRLFCNIDPGRRPRVWQIGEPFETFVGRFLPGIELVAPRRKAAFLARFGIGRGARSAYDRMMAEIRRRGKRDALYQGTAAKRIIEFPYGSCWFAITDLVLHGAVSGQHSLDQTYLLPTAAMSHPEWSSLRILERLSGRHLV